MYKGLLLRLGENYRKKGKNERNSYGVFSGIMGLISNVILFLAKLFLGLLSGSVSIIADAVNNLSDAASSVLMLVGFYISGKPADKNHPYGHERFENISGMLVSVLILFVGLQFMSASFDKIVHPEGIRISPVLFLILVFSILVKIAQSLLYQEIGKTIDSNALVAAAKDSLNDVFTTVAVLIGAVVELFTGWRIDGYIGFLLALYIIITGIRLVIGFIHDLMGRRPSQEMIDEMENLLSSFSEIHGFHDLLIHDYGKKKIFASVHIEMDDSWSVVKAHQVIDTIEKIFMQKQNVDLVCHLDPVNLMASSQKIQNEMDVILKSFPQGLRMHDFRITSKGQKEILNFDLVIPQEYEWTEDTILGKLREQVAISIGEYELLIAFDRTYLL